MMRVYKCTGADKTNELGTRVKEDKGIRWGRHHITNRRYQIRKVCELRDQRAPRTAESVLPPGRHFA